MNYPILWISGHIPSFTYSSLNTSLAKLFPPLLQIRSPITYTIHMIHKFNFITEKIKLYIIQWFFMYNLQVIFIFISSKRWTFYYILKIFTKLSNKSHPTSQISPIIKETYITKFFNPHITIYIFKNKCPTPTLCLVLSKGQIW